MANSDVDMNDAELDEEREEEIVSENKRKVSNFILNNFIIIIRFLYQE